MTQRLAEILAIGDEMIGGARLDTNTQYLAQQLSEIGVQVAYHTTVGDDPRRQAEVFRVAARRVDLVVSTGGLGPTDDDLTRQILAEIMGVNLFRNEAVAQHIRGIFQKYGRVMPESNLVQADFPAGSRIIPNAEGTAPGIDADIELDNRRCRFFCLPGVPSEMKAMWHDYVRPQIVASSESPQVFITQVINCFGAGESQIAADLGDLIERGREPVVGITASQSIISLRVTARGATEADCWQKIQPVETFIRQRLGNLVFGTGEATLEQVVIDRLQQAQQTLAIADFGLSGDVAAALSRAQGNKAVPSLVGGLYRAPEPAERHVRPHLDTLRAHAGEIRELMQTTWGLTISWPFTPPADQRPHLSLVLADGKQLVHETFPQIGSESLRHHRSVRHCLNFLRQKIEELGQNPSSFV